MAGLADGLVSLKNMEWSQESGKTEARNEDLDWTGPI